MKEDFETILDTIRTDPRYLANLDWGRPRRGHSEGTVRAHIAELEENLAGIADRLTAEQRARILVLVHVHDTFKPDAQSGVGIEHPRSHASLARAFLAEFTTDADLLAMAQWHDVPYALWRKFHDTDRLNEERLGRLIDAIEDWGTFVPFLLVDNCTEGKGGKLGDGPDGADLGANNEPLKWFVELLASRPEHEELVRFVVGP